MTDLASILLLASLHSRKIHITNVTTKDDIGLIDLAKQKGLQVTCDVSVYALFFSQDDYPEASFLPTAKDQEALWEHMNIIDVFSIGSLPYQLATLAKAEADAAVGIADTLPLLFSAVADGRLTVDDIKARLHDNPKEIFEIHDQVGASVEVEIDRPHTVKPGTVWSPLVGQVTRGAVQRVIFQDKTACLDGLPTQDAIDGKDMSSHLIDLHTTVPQSPLVKANLGSPAMGPRPDSSHGLRKFSSFAGASSSAMRPATRSRFLDGAASQAPQLGSTAEDLGAPLYPQPTISPSLQTLLGQSPFKNQHVLSVNQFSPLGVQREGVLSILKGRLLCTMFYEPSTRTSASFDAAMQRLGGRTVAIATSHSSTVKGESLADTIRTLGCYGDAIVLRHPEESSASTAAKFSPVPIINGGNGSKEHPTQAFLDLFTIREELGTVGGLTITFTGDLRYGRTVHSLVKLLQHYDVHIQLVSPQALSLPQEILALIKSKPGQLLSVSTELTPEILARSDVLYCTRVQKERFADLEEYERLKDSFIIDNKTLRNAKSSMIVMHPLPRNAEIGEEVDFDQRAAYFRQMRYGLYCRMALLALVLAP
ncbi:similar to isoaspartyl dipeptidase (secreted protein) [Botrytis cinerea T4]|uniref:aspartate carbamoyltransferase n=1 Tax=Botryotinia fuckeliana (strain T4) TaxID=999810 RepID=G2YMB0_BOTF4|nr:similar to isoaspartyl dipeptidase (secreted protein) [Botrytis cinerea T4]